MTAIAHPPSKVGPSTYQHNIIKAHSSTLALPLPPPPPPPHTPARIVQCGICLDDFEWFSLKDLNGYQEDPKDTNANATAATTRSTAWPINCPHENCREAVCSFAVETLLGSDALQWHQLAVEHAIQKKIYCPYTACARLIDGDRNDDQEPVDRHCPYCSKPFCSMCYGEAHKVIGRVALRVAT
ncbi:hypothetical protein BGX24_002842 [Mortierella sp. AD032]|nr:hypothetical protein BGX24_002842 [Mortierella sp. AD032]